MESKSENQLLKIRPGAVDYIRKLYDLDKPGRLEDALTILTEWILKQDHIIKKDFSKDYLERTLIQCKGSVEKAKKQIEQLCTMKTMVPKFFSKTNAIKELPKVSDVAWVVPLSTLTEDYYRIIMIKPNNRILAADTFVQYFQYNILICEYLKAHDYINGLILIFDYGEINFAELLAKANIVDVQQFISIILNGYGARVKAIHLLTNSNFIEMSVKIIRQIVVEKIGRRIYIQRTLEDLHKAVPREILPVEYGGNEKPIPQLFEKWVELLSSEKNVKYMEMMKNACTDETKRIKGTFNEEYLGMPGSFRCLSVD